ncbi:hypothetical protein GYMLUDRAFT_774221 [Collybiopsis luxurians FD-317 M1]|uniref:Unplaced genomic scaffold GYMLUscaffold_45, whole genome shotgun sequence n=1 Tax=Collybiopsis luxurians FD-317 M1 TaxID=944289 RepID=A0A0D0C3X1_9AGAR|nr:hypothetical protein GYMLUDRAFT_774221 [Collybiopsis luxurians FD-317 M1]
MEAYVPVHPQPRRHQFPPWRHHFLTWRHYLPPWRHRIPPWRHSPFTWRHLASPCITPSCTGVTSYYPSGIQTSLFPNLNVGNMGIERRAWLRTDE